MPPDLDVYSGVAGLYRTRHGNLRTDGTATVLGRALAHGRQPDDTLWFGPGPLPGPAEPHVRSPGRGSARRPGRRSSVAGWLAG
jgi:hypothetical protein